MAEQSLHDFLIERSPELAQRTAEHLMLTTVSVLVATALGLAIAVLAFRVKALRNPLTTIVGILQTVPSLAMLVMLMTLLGKIGILPALVALTLYALLPIVRNTLIGLESTPAANVEAAQGIGMTEAQQLRMVRFPLAMPAIVAGIRTATVVGVGIATLSAFIGAGGLGEFINRGLALSNTRLILLGAIPAGILAMLADWTLAIGEWGFRPLRETDKPLDMRQRRFRRSAAASLPLMLFAFSIIFYVVEHPPIDAETSISIGSKHFTEQLILAELLAQTIESRTKLSVRRRFDLGGTSVCHGALIRGEIDAYPEYTGTGLISILNIKNVSDPAKVFSIVEFEYARQFQITWTKPFGFNNTWAVISNSSAPWRKISDLIPVASTLTLGVPAEFSEREDGLPNLKKAYGLKFGKIEDVDTNIAYKALKEHELDLAAGNSTDGRIASYKLRVLEDDRHYFPPYQAAAVLRSQSVRKHPELLVALNSLGGKIDDDTMRNLNFAVDNGQSPATVVHQFLAKHPEITAH